MRSKLAGWLWVLASGLTWPGATLAEINPPVPADAPSPRLLPVCANALYHACGLVDRRGDWVVKPVYSALYASGDYWIAERRSGLLGLLDADGKVLIEPSLQEIGRFADGLAPARPLGERKTGYIDERGHFAIPPAYDMAGAFSDGLAIVGNDVAGALRMGAIDRRQRVVVPLGKYDDIDAFAFGLAVVRRETNGGMSAGAIDTHGILVVPFHPAASLKVVARGRLLESDVSGDGSTYRARLLDGSGRVLFGVEGEQARIDDPAEGLAFFADGDGRLGLLDVLAAKVVVAPRRDWAGATSFSDGVAWLQENAAGDKTVRVLVDRQGREVLRRDYESVSDFHAGMAAVSYGERRWGLIDRAGKVLHDFNLDYPHDPWEWSTQSPRPGDATLALESTALDPPASRQRWLDRHGATMVSVEPLACGIETVRNARGDTIWPAHVAASCALKLRDSDGGVAASQVPADELRDAERDAAGWDVAWLREVDRRDAGENAPTMTGMPRVPDTAPWQHGPAAIRLSGPATLALPPGYRYLAPEAARGVPGMPAEAAQLPMALIGPDDGAWLAQLIVAQQGYVPTEDVQLDAESLRQTMEVYSTNVFASLNSKRVRHRSVEWLEPPAWDAERHRLAWAYRLTAADLSLDGTSSRFGTEIYLNTVSLGRTHAAALQMVLAGTFAQQQWLAMDHPFATLVDAIRFDEGERYTDHRPDDKQAALGLAEFITGPEPKEMQIARTNLMASEHRHDAQMRGQVLRLVGALLGMVAVAAGAWRRRGGKGGKAS